jgi:DNA-binding LytR/AlgR family response regulator
MNTPLRDLHPKSSNQESRIRQLEDELNNLRQRMALKYDTIIIHHHGIKRIVPFHQIVMLQSQGNYTYIFLSTGEKLLTSKTLKYWQDKISSPDFIRTHNSNMINKYHLKQIDYKKRSLLLESGCMAKISRSMGKEFFAF